MLSETLKKFGYPNTLIKEYNNWYLLCRPEQISLASLVLICKDEVNAFSKISKKSFAEFPKIIKEIETIIKKTFNYDKINYLMLMMKDPEVHFHIIPRYSTDKEFEGVIFKDPKWSRSIDLHILNEINEVIFDKLVEKLKSAFEQ
jgi:diadenosine tetraphosphate (Ap4A) HIT family hydrolase